MATLKKLLLFYFCIFKCHGETTDIFEDNTPKFSISKALRFFSKAIYKSILMGGKPVKNMKQIDGKFNEQVQNYVFFYTSLKSPGRLRA